MRRFWQLVPRVSAIQPCWRQPFSLMKTNNKQPLYALLTQKNYAMFAGTTLHYHQSIRLTFPTWLTPLRKVVYRN